MTRIKAELNPRNKYSPARAILRELRVQQAGPQGAQQIGWAACSVLRLREVGTTLAVYGMRMLSEKPLKVLVADDEPLTRTKLTYLVQKWGYEVVATANGTDAWTILQGPNAPVLALLDWQMPGRTGDEICRLARAHLSNHPLHIILVTATRLTMEEKVQGLGSGADDYLIKPFDSTELHARLQVGERVVKLQQQLRDRVSELQSALAQVTQLQGLLPICMDCKKIRDDRNYWHQVESYISARTEVSFTHSLCPTCFKKRVREFDVSPAEVCAEPYCGCASA